MATLKEITISLMLSSRQRKWQRQYCRQYNEDRLYYEFHLKPLHHCCTDSKRLMTFLSDTDPDTQLSYLRARGAREAANQRLLLLPRSTYLRQQLTLVWSEHDVAFAKSILQHTLPCVMWGRLHCRTDVKAAYQRRIFNFFIKPTQQPSPLSCLHLWLLVR